MIPEAAWWEPMSNGQTACRLCPIGCRLRMGQDGPCGTRRNRNGRMEPLHYGRLVSAAVDPIEKKPLYHYHPGRPILSIAAPGCNMHCLFCQNWTISQRSTAPTQETTPQQVVEMARRDGSVGIAYTYSEPLVWYEFVRDTARLAAAEGLKNVLVTNALLNAEPLAELLPYIHAANIDLKAMDDRFYRRICKAPLAPVMTAIDQFVTAGVHVEITNLVIPGYNDRDDQIADLVEFIAGIDRSLPLHFSAYHPAWKLDAPRTPLATLQKARAIAVRRLDWVYLGNITTEEGRDTVCPDCGTVVIARSGYQTRLELDDSGRCAGCGRSVNVVTD